MKNITILGLIIFFFIACKDNSKTSNAKDAQQNYSNLTPLAVVTKRMNYFNEHNYDEFIKLYNTNVEVYTYPDKLMGTGSDRLGSIFKKDFENKAVAVKVVNQMDNGPYVINHEIVTTDGKEQKYISIYKVEKGLISTVSFVRGF
ncbi:hypothetical protein [Flagellimonas pacifica]|uniref:SnoaL-like domain-containing protein n=1 Tax=Flagellimonas pacifica TaxID=1247520 RepID=A0A285MSD2_9FLAO|nr:hypothetical protein [Allomuricauda parva]SNY99437.1 hypothetical protein SAMN06265377_1243 [Allomuricauda parva]